jgi:ribosomal protein S12 methylthiotransferase
MSDDMIDAMAECKSVCNYVDIPLQHINDRMLKAMHRRIDRASTERLMDKIRSRIPGVSIRTTLISGFPSETDEEHEELRQFVANSGFDALGVFPYSREPETPAGRMSGAIPSEVVEERIESLMLTQQEVAFRLADQRKGRDFDILVDEYGENGSVWGRHEGQAVSVDSMTRVDTCKASPGQFVRVRCTGRSDYDLVARPTERALPVVLP